MFYPLKFIPVYKDYLWGGRNLEKLGRKLPDGIVAESWEISAHPDGVSIISNGDLKGMTLPEYIDKFGSMACGTALSPRQMRKFPLLVKLIDANQQLSVQVHPDDNYAQQHENEEYGKTEMWYIISAKPGSKIIYDLKPGITKELFKQAIVDGKTESCLNFLEVAAGDVIYIPAGIIHALGSGLVLAEIQQNSNATYRVYDYNRVDAAGRKRPLHIEKALEVIQFDFPRPMPNPNTQPQKMVPESPDAVLVDTPFFTVELSDHTGTSIEFADGERFFLYTFFAGECLIHYHGGTVKVNVPESVMIPASLGEYCLEGNFKALKTYIR